MWSYEICGPTSGDRYDSIELSSVSWQIRMNGQIGSGTAVVQTRDPGLKHWTPGYFQLMTRSWRRVLVGKWDDQPIWAKIITDWDLDFGTGELTLQISEIGALLRKRHYFPATSYSPSATATVGPHTPTSMLKATALLVCGGGYWAEGRNRIPLHVGDLASGNRSFTTKQSEFLHPWNYMADASAEENGIDWLLEPSFGSGSDEAGDISGLQWWLRTGRPMDQRSVHHFIVNAPNTPLLNLRVGDNARDYASAVYAVGEGTGEDRPVRRIRLDESPEIPKVVQFNQTSDVDKLQALAAGELEYAQTTPDVWSFDMPASYALVRRGGEPNDGVRLGSRIFIDYADPFYGTGQVELYVIGLSGNGGDLVSVEVQVL